MNGLTNIDYSDYMPKPEAKNVTTEAMVSRQAQEVQMAMYVAKISLETHTMHFNEL